MNMKYWIVKYVNLFIAHLFQKKRCNLFYKKKFYNQKRKKNYFLIQKKQITWWNRIFQERLNKFEKILGRAGTVLDIGCGPGFFLKFAKKKDGKLMVLIVLKVQSLMPKKLKLKILKC